MKLKILEAAAEEIELHGTSFRMDDLAKRLSISKRTLYENFNSKNEIIETLLTSRAEDFSNQYKEILSDETLDCRSKLIKLFSLDSRVFNTLSGTRIRDMFNRMPFLIERLTNLGKSNWIELGDYLKEEQKLGHIRDMDIDVLVLMLQSLVYYILYDPSRNPDDCQMYLQQAIIILLDGIMLSGEEKKG